MKIYQFHAKGYFRHRVKLNCFKDDNVKIVFASTLNVFLLENFAPWYTQPPPYQVFLTLALTFSQPIKVAPNDQS